MTNPQNAALIVAAGRGYRVGGPLPKQYLMLGGISILRRTIMAFLDHPEIHHVQVLIHPDDLALYEAATDGLALPPPRFGGALRQDSVRLGLAALAAFNPANVLIHDAVRPFIAPGIISAVLAALRDSHGAMPGLAVTDTLKRCADGAVFETIDRANLFRAQTPQGFRYAGILAAHRAAHAAPPARELTDDVMVAEQAGLRVALVPGSEQNFKITTPEDLARAELLIRSINEEGTTP